MQTLLLALGSLAVGILAGWLRGTAGNVRYVRVQPPPADGAVPPPGNSARGAAEFVREVVALADRLAARDICVRKLACEPYWFWELVLQKGAEADQGEKAARSRLTRVFWDGMEHDLSVEWAPFVPGPDPDDWNHELRTPLGRTGDAIGAAEDVLIRRFSGSAGTNPGPA